MQDERQSPESEMTQDHASVTQQLNRYGVEFDLTREKNENDADFAARIIAEVEAVMTCLEQDFEASITELQAELDDLEQLKEQVT